MSAAVQTLTPEKVAVIEALSTSPIAAEALAAHEAERARRRRWLIEAARTDEAAAKAEAERAGTAAVQQRVEVDRLRAELLQASTRLRALENDATNQQALAERALLRLAASLEPLGGSAIDAAVHRLVIAERQSRSLIDHRIQKDAYGRTLGVIEAEPAHAARARAMRAWITALEALRFDLRTTPAEIEAKCREATAAIDSTTPTTPRGSARWPVPIEG